MEEELNYEETKNFVTGRDVEEVVTSVIDAAVLVHRELGPGLLESVYHCCLERELQLRSVPTSSEVPVAVCFKGLTLPSGYRADLIAASCVLVEIKAVEAVLPVHKAQVITYLKLTRLPIGLLLNFNTPLLKDGLHRFVRPDLLRSESDPSSLLRSVKN